MRMTIDEAIKHGKERLVIYGGEHKEFIQIAIETMLKYQQIIDAMLMNDMVENIYFAIEEILKDDLEQDERFGK